MNHDRSGVDKSNKLSSDNEKNEKRGFARPGRLFPPLGWGMVEMGLYRSETPEVENFPFLRTLSFVTVIKLGLQGFNNLVKLFFEEERINVVTFSAKQYQVSRAIASDILICEVLKFVFNKRYYPLLICGPGRQQQVDVIIGCIRRLLHWSFNSILTEYRLYAGDRKRPQTELRMEKFDISIIPVPTNPPQWYIRLAAVNETEAKEYIQLKGDGKLTPSGRLKYSEGVPKFRVHFYDRAAPLNTSVPPEDIVIRVPPPPK